MQSGPIYYFPDKCFISWLTWIIIFTHQPCFPDRDH